MTLPVQYNFQSGADDDGVTVTGSMQCPYFIRRGMAQVLDLPPETKIFDLSNACLGVLNGMVQIANAIKEKHNMDIDRKMIHVDGESIKELGEYTAKIILHKEVEVDLKFEVIAE